MDKWTDGWMMDEYKILKKQTKKIPIHRDKKQGQNASPKPPTCQTCSAPHGNHPLPPAAADVWTSRGMDSMGPEGPPNLHC